jgi:hypothetical protein
LRRPAGGVRSGIRDAVAILGFLACALVASRPVAGEPARPPNAVYLEGLGRASLGGLGYERDLGPVLSVGALGSYLVLRGEHVAQLAPYVGVAPLGGPRHRLVVQGGALLAWKRTPAPVPELPDRTDRGVAAQLALGYEYRRGIVVRGFAMVSAGRHAVYPWLGLDLGWSW